MASKFLQDMIKKASQDIKTIVLPEGEDERVLQAAHIISDAKAAKLIILGDQAQISAYFAKNNWSLSDIEILKPEESPRLEEYASLLYDLRKSKGMTQEQAHQTVLQYNYFATLMVKAGHADGMVSGACHSTADTVRPALQIIKSAHPDRGISAFFFIISNDTPYLLSDPALVINPNEKELADIAITTADTALKFGIDPKIAMLSFSTKGSGKAPEVDKVVNATKIAQEILKSDEYKNSGIMLDGELQSDAAVDLSVAARKAPGSSVAGHARLLIVPNLDVGNISYKLLQRLGGCEAYGPILQGLNAPINDLSRGAYAEDIAGVIAITCIQSTH